jgi:uncharacterized protein YcbX
LPATAIPVVSRYVGMRWNSAPDFHAAVLLAVATVVGVVTHVIYRQGSFTKLASNRRQQVGAAVIIDELWVFPVKGLRGIRVSGAELDPCGLVLDREWVVLSEDPDRAKSVKDGTRVFLTLRNAPKMATITTRVIVVDCDGIELEKTDLTGSLRAASDAFLVLSHPVHGAVRVPVKSPDTAAPTVEYSIWGMPGGAVYCGAPAAAFLSKVLGRPVGLYRSARPRNPNDDERKRDLVSDSARVHGQDFGPLMLMSSATVAEARDACGDASVDAHRFRPNIVVVSEGPRVEEELREFTTADGGIRFKFVQYCERCVVPTVRDDGTFHPTFEPTKTLRQRFSGNQWSDPCGPAAPFAGIDVFHEFTDNAATPRKGKLRTGDLLMVTRVGPRPLLGAWSRPR